MQNTNATIILNSIIKEAGLFLKDDMSLKIIKMETFDNIIQNIEYSSLITLKGSIDITVLISIDEKLFNILFNKFFKNGVIDDDKDELVDALSDEILNTIVGLSIKNFPSKFKELNLGIPFKLEKENMSNYNLLKSFTINTLSGSLSCSIFKN